MKETFFPLKAWNVERLLKFLVLFGFSWCWYSLQSMLADPYSVDMCVSFCFIISPKLICASWFFAICANCWMHALHPICSLAWRHMCFLHTFVHLHPSSFLCNPDIPLFKLNGPLGCLGSDQNPFCNNTGLRLLCEICWDIALLVGRDGRRGGASFKVTFYIPCLLITLGSTSKDFYRIIWEFWQNLKLVKTKKVFLNFVE